VGSVFCDLNLAFMSYRGLKSQYANLMMSTKEFAITYLDFFKKNLFFESLRLCFALAFVLQAL